MRFVLLTIGLSISLYSQVRVLGGQIWTPNPVFFIKKSTEVTTQSDSVLRLLSDFLKRNEHVTRIRIECHSDNQKLSVLRSVIIGGNLVDKGISCDRLLPTGFGDMPMTSDSSVVDSTGIVKFFITCFKGKPVSIEAEDGGGLTSPEFCNRSNGVNKLEIEN